MNPKLLEQLRLAKEAGTKAMAKDFFAPTPGSGGPDEGSPQEEASESPDEAQTEGDISPEQLEELLKMLQSQGGGAQ